MTFSDHHNIIKETGEEVLVIAVEAFPVLAKKSLFLPVDGIGS